MNTAKLRGRIAEYYGSQRAYCRATGWKPNKLCKLLKNNYVPDVNEVANLASNLQLTPDDVIDIFLPKKSPNGDKEEATRHEKRA